MASVFKILGNDKRRKILKLLREQEMHISGIARELNTSVPVVFRHVKKLEEAGLIKRKQVGNTHILYINDEWSEKINSIWTLLEEPLTVKTRKGTTLSDVLKKMPDIEVRKTIRGEYINSVDGKEGFFVYEINGKLADKPINEYMITRDLEVEIKRLIPAYDKKIKIQVE